MKEGIIYKQLDLSPNMGFMEYSTRRYMNILFWGIIAFTLAALVGPLVMRANPAYAACDLPDGVGGGTTVVGEDADCDGISDSWEADSVAFPGANPNHKDIYLEIDYMTYHQPDAVNVITPIVNAFNAVPNLYLSNPDGLPGINLHVWVSNELVAPFTHQNVINLWTDFDTIKNANFGNGLSAAVKVKRLNVWHYGVFIHTYEDTSTTGSDVTFSGKARNPHDFVVSLGDPGWAPDPVTGHVSVGSTDQKQGTMMHEIGHNLGLRHGGGDDINCKPNYLSVMNYAFQFSNFVGTRPLDYSRSVLNALVEATGSPPVGGLNEGAGVSASTPTGLKTVYGPTSPLKVRTTGQPFDWNRNLYYYDTGVNADINNLGITDCYASPSTGMNGFQDWNNLLYWGTSGTSSGNNTLAGNNSTNKSELTIMPDDNGSKSEQEVGINDVIKSRHLLWQGVFDSIKRLNNTAFAAQNSSNIMLNILSNDVKPYLGNFSELDNQTNKVSQLVPSLNSQAKISQQSNLTTLETSNASQTSDPTPGDLNAAIRALQNLRALVDGDVGGDLCDDLILPNCSTTTPDFTVFKRDLVDEIDNFIAALQSQI